MKRPRVTCEIDRRNAPRSQVLATCILHAVGHSKVIHLTEISAAGALIDSGIELPSGEPVQLQHAQAGWIDATVIRHTKQGLAIQFVLNEASVTFALRLLASEMSNRHLMNHEAVV